MRILVAVAESAEHQFLSQCVTALLDQLSRTRLYAYVEAERRKFDFACELKRDWSRPLVGQTLWNHTAGVDKDLRTMLLDTDAEICTYVARDTVKARRLLSEVIKDFRSAGTLIAPHRLRVFWVPHDFDADDESQRNLVTGLLREGVSRRHPHECRLRQPDCRGRPILYPDYWFSWATLGSSSHDVDIARAISAD